MNKRERVQAALAGREVDQPPVSLWRHFPDGDQTATDLARSTLAWQEMLDLDFIKLMPPGDYVTIDWGAVSEFRGAPGGTRQTVHYPVQSPDDWASITPVDPESGFNGQMVEACRLVREGVGADVPLLQTVFSPLTIANKLSNGLVLEHLRSHPDAVHSALNVIRDVTVQVARASLAAGADGIFFASQCATSDMTTGAEYQEFGIPYDLPVVEAANDAGSIFTLIHIHGANTYFNMLAGYPGNALNWHDRRVGPSISEVRESYPDRAAVAGIDEHGIVSMSADDAAQQARGARQEAGDRGLLIGPGCVVQVAVPEENLKAVVRAARE